MKKNITVTGMVSGDLFNELVSFKVEIIPVMPAAIKYQNKIEKAILNFKKWKNDFFTLDGFDNYNFKY